MPRPLRQRVHHLSRLLRLLVLALCLVAQPAFSMVGEVHDVLEHAGPLGGHHETSQVHAEDDDGHDDLSALRFLMHYAHCCASTNAVLEVAMTVPSGTAAARLTLPHPGLGRTQTRPDHPFRPPIER